MISFLWCISELAPGRTYTCERRLRNRELVSRVMDDLEGRELNEKEKRNLESVQATLKSLE